MSTDNGDDDEGGVRGTDPWSAQFAAQMADVKGHYQLILRYYSYQLEPRNGWEMSKGVNRHTTAVVPRLCPMRTIGLIDYICLRPGAPPKYRPQMSYLITDYGRQALADPKVFKEVREQMRKLKPNSPLRLMDKARVAAAKLTDVQWGELVERENKRRSESIWD